MKYMTQTRFKAGFVALAMLLTQVAMPVQSAFANQGVGVGASGAGGAGGGNQDCPAGTTLLTKFNYDAQDGYVRDTSTTSFVTINSGATATGGTFTVTGGHAVSAVIVKGGNESKIDVISPAVASGSFDNTGLANGGGKAPDISNIKFCENTVVALTNVQPAVPTNIDECGVMKDSYTITATEGVDYKINGTVVAANTYMTSANSVTISAEAKTGYTLVGYTGPWTLPFPNNQACEVPKTPVAPGTVTFEDVCGTANDKVMIPTKEGVDYYVNGTLTDAGTYPASGKVVVTAKAQAGYALTGNVDSWTKEFTDIECPGQNVCTVPNNDYNGMWTFGGYTYPEAGTGLKPGKQGDATPGSFTFEQDGLHISTPAELSYVMGLIDAGNTPLSNIDRMSYKTIRLASSTGNPIQVTAYVVLADIDGNLTTKVDQTYFVYEPVYNGTVQTGVWQYWNVLNDGNSKWWGTDGNGDPDRTWSQIVNQYPNAVAIAYGFNQGTSNKLTNSVIQDLEFDCQTTTFGQGMGGTETPQEPPVVVTPTFPTQSTSPVTPVATQGNGLSELPAELPMTGSGSVISTWFALLAAVLTYGAVLYLQPKKRIEE